MNKTKFQCPFDKIHVFKTQQQLYKHQEKCKSPNKMNFQQCSYNKNHWVNFSKRKQHQEQCKDKLSSSQLSMEDSVLKGLVNQLDYSRSLGIEQQLQSMRKQMQRSNEMMKKNKRNNKKKQEEPQTKQWREPSFRQWIKQNFLTSNFRSNQFEESQFIDSQFQVQTMMFNKY